MIQPVGRLQHRRSLADARPGDLDAIARRGELHALMARRLGQLLLVRPRIGCPLPDPDRSGKVLHPLSAHVAERLAEPIPDRLEHDVGDAHAAGLREPLQTRGDVHAVAEHVAFVEHDIAEIYPDPIDDPTVDRARAFALRHRGLDADGAAHGVLRGSELRQHAVARGLDDASAAARDRGVDQLPPVRLLTLEHALLILLHEPAVARHVRDEDGRESTLHGPSPDELEASGASSPNPWAKIPPG
jgi:hypothetical protein